MSVETPIDELARPAVASVPPSKKGGAGRILLGLGGGCLGVVLLGCVITGVLAYDGGGDFDAEPFSASTELTQDGTGGEALRIKIEGGPEGAWYQVSGPAIEADTGCTSMYRATGSEHDDVCEIPLAGVPAGGLDYTVEAFGLPSRFFGVRMGGPTMASTGVRVERPFGLAWSERRNATICMGATCELVLEDGEIRVSEAPDGTQVSYEGQTGSTVPVDVFSLADRVGLDAVLTHDEGRAQVPGVAVDLPTGQSVTGAMEVPLETLRASWIQAVEVLSREDSVPALSSPGAAALWVNNGYLEETAGSPTRGDDVAVVVVQGSERHRATPCGPYASELQQESYRPRTRIDTTVTVVDRATGSVSRRQFRGPLPTCPPLVVESTTVRGQAAPAATQYARNQFRGARDRLAARPSAPTAVVAPALSTPRRAARSAQATPSAQAAPSTQAARSSAAGSLPRNVISAAMRRVQPRVRQCYQRALASKPSLAGRVAIAIVVSPSGRVQSANVASSSLGDRVAETCITQAIRTATFPASSNATRITYPFVFGPS